jgi:hypothetical protein
VEHFKEHWHPAASWEGSIYISAVACQLSSPTGSVFCAATTICVTLGLRYLPFPRSSPSVDAVTYEWGSFMSYYRLTDWYTDYYNLIRLKIIGTFVRAWAIALANTCWLLIAETPYRFQATSSENRRRQVTLGQVFLRVLRLYHRNHSIIAPYSLSLLHEVCNSSDQSAHWKIWAPS